MKIYIISILLFTLTFSLKAEKNIEVTPIKLPYDSLQLKEICAFNSTILVRSGDTIYKSTDDGKNWRIVLESKKKINQFYTFGPHTIFVVGDSGMVYRTFDYGESWFDLSYGDTTYNFKSMAAKSFENYLIASDYKAFVKTDQEKDLTPLDFTSDIALYDVICSGGKYYFYGRVKKRYYMDYGLSVADISMPYNVYDGEKITTLFSIEQRNLIQDYYTVYTDSLRLFPSKYGVYHSAVNRASSGINLNYGVKMIYSYGYNTLSFGSDRIASVDEDSLFSNFFTKGGIWTSLKTDTLLEDMYYLSLKNIEHQDLGIKPINSVFKVDSNSYYISSNNSTIYKVEFSEVPTNVENESNLDYKLLADKILLGSGVKLLNVYNYIGISLQYTILSENIYQLPKGLNFITYTINGQIKTIKVVVM